MAEETHLIDELSVKRPQEEEAEENGGISVKMEKSNRVAAEVALAECISTIIPGWFSEISPMWPGKFATLFTMAPEVLHRSYGTEADMWSTIGVIAYTLLCGSRPFWSRTEKQRLKKWPLGAVNFAGYELAKKAMDKN
ncbi:unnamed protein product [Fraxinus pennsylvanica]|uniref:Protein kinase domain-containing protein n=1 Tax=Fraxinus pennsylvanica TaxID=56036 RepID=A0AAD2A545_9LAMI|nr:unnamed protein product [Fraxinus pennsylvanica]